MVMATGLIIVICLFMAVPVSIPIWLWFRNNIYYPLKFYKLTIFDVNDEFVFYRKKKDAKIIEDKYGFMLFERVDKDDGKERGEIYAVSTDEKNKPSKRDDYGVITFYYFRNNPNPLNIVNKDKIEIDNDASFMYKIHKTNIFDSALLETKQFHWNWTVIIILVILVILIVVFREQIIGLVTGEGVKVALNSTGSAP